MARVLVVEDNDEALALVERALGDVHEMLTARTLEAARAIAQVQSFDLALVDLALPDGTGFTFCSELRSDPARDEIPVIFVAGSAETADKVMAFQLGAEDYVQKPFSQRELRARIEARLRRRRERGGAQPLIRVGNVRLDAARYKALVGSGEATRSVDLTPHEFRLLRHLAERAGQVVARESLLEALWAPVVVSGRTIDTHVGNLRAKLGSCRLRIEAIRAVGYRLVAMPEES